MRPARLLALSALSAALVLGLTGCGSGGGDPARAEGGGPATISYGIWDKNQAPAMQKIIDEFRTANPDITVKLQVTPYKQYWTTLQTAATGGGAPDVFWMNGPNIKLYAGNGQLLPLDGTIKDGGLNLADYPASLVDLYTWDGKTYGIPKDFDTIGVWYNKSLFDAAGVEHPTDDWTWADFQATARKLTDPAKGIYGAAAPVENQAGYYDTIHSAGGEIISADGAASGYGSPEALQGIEFWTSLVKDGASPTVQQMTDTSPYDMFKAGKIAMLWNGSWAAGEYHGIAELKDTVDVVRIPAGPKGSISVIHGLGNVVYAKTKHPEAAQKFLSFLGTRRAAEIQAETGAVIPAFNGTQQKWVDAMPQFNLKAYIDEVPDAAAYPVSKETKTWNTLETEILTKVWTGEVDAATGLKDLATQMDAALAKEQ
ncbi:sugar ABC transporter substrate-binding protein [Intrasporangium sp. DVR]|uniref:ABC transporter substrate-binding protein n=1 Tax=Intrasporangium sp. DVR TaxID=3127867 RepID=UPI00313A70B8